MQLLHALQEFSGGFGLGIERCRVQVHFQALQLIQSFEHVAMPQIPLDGFGSGAKFLDGLPMGDDCVSDQAASTAFQIAGAA